MTQASVVPIIINHEYSHIQSQSSDNFRCRMLEAGKDIRLNRAVSDIFSRIGKMIDDH